MKMSVRNEHYFLNVKIQNYYPFNKNKYTLEMTQTIYFADYTYNFR